MDNECSALTQNPAATTCQEASRSVWLESANGTIPSPVETRRFGVVHKWCIFGAQRMHRLAKAPKRAWLEGGEDGTCVSCSISLVYALRCG